MVELSCDLSTCMCVNDAIPLSKFLKQGHEIMQQLQVENEHYSYYLVTNLSIVVVPTFGLNC